MHVHAFSVKIATQVGLVPSIILSHIAFIINESERPYAVRTVSGMCKTYPYLSPKEIRGALSKLEELGLIHTLKEFEGKVGNSQAYMLTKKGYELAEVEPKKATRKTKIDLPKGQIELPKGQIELPKGQITPYYYSNNIITPTTTEGGENFKSDEVVLDSLHPHRQKEKNDPHISAAAAAPAAADVNEGDAGRLLDIAKEILKDTKDQCGPIDEHNLRVDARFALSAPAFVLINFYKAYCEGTGENSLDGFKEKFTAFVKHSLMNKSLYQTNNCILAHFSRWMNFNNNAAPVAKKIKLL